MKKVFKYFLLLILMAPMAFIFAACGGGESFEPYLDVEGDFESEYEFDIDKETNTITFTTSGPDKTINFNPEEVHLLLKRGVYGV